MSQMINFLKKQKPVILTENFNDINTFLKEKKPIILTETFEENKNKLIIPPLNTNIQFTENFIFNGEAGINDNKLIIPPLNTNIQFQEMKRLERYKYSLKNNFKNEKFQNIPETFSWHIIHRDDSDSIKDKKRNIQKPKTQYSCGSCWAMCFADVISDCLVVSNTVSWDPKISATYLMSILPTGAIHDKCLGGNPAAAAQYLSENNIKLLDRTCIDYSWCSQDDICTSIDSTQHFNATQLAENLNAKIPSPGCYFDSSEKYIYEIDESYKVYSLTKDMSPEMFRKTVQTHILKYGPVIAGYVVLNNFFTGNFADENINGGIYFDRANYSNLNNITFSDTNTQRVAGLHAISVVGWGIKKNIQYDNHKFGNVPYWICRNSWSEKWGNDGYFKIAMYPYNKIAQVDKEVTTNLGGPIGGMILIKATKKPYLSEVKQIDDTFLNNIKRSKPNDFYINDISQLNNDKVASNNNMDIYKKLVTVFLFLIIVIILIYANQ
jgi:hypothetical protein